MSRLVSILGGLFWAFVGTAVVLAFGVFLLRTARAKVPAVGTPAANITEKLTGLNV